LNIFATALEILWFTGIQCK